MARIYRIPFAAAAAAAALAASTSAPAQTEDGPIWTRKPSPSDAERYYPRTGGGMGGSAALRYGWSLPGFRDREKADAPDD